MADTAAEFRAAALELKAADRALMNLARKNIRIATAPAAAAVKRSALSSLPKGGGANQVIASKKVSTSTLTGLKTAGVRIRVKGQAPVNAGTLKHPVFGNRDIWATTSVEPGYASRPLDAVAGEVEAACIAVMAETSAIAGFH